MPRPMVPAPTIATVLISIGSPLSAIESPIALNYSGASTPQDIMHALEKDEPHCHTVSCAALLQKSEAREIVPCCRECLALPAQANPFPKEPYRQFPRCAGNTPTDAVEECQRHPYTYSGDDA